MENQQDPHRHLRGDGRVKGHYIQADNLVEATHKAILANYQLGARVETPKHQSGGSLGYDLDFLIEVVNPDSEPKVHKVGMSEDGRGLMQYILEVTHGIHNHWLKCKEHPEWWGYTYNGRFTEQMPFVLQRIKHDWDKRKRITGRDYQFATWRAGEDIILEQEDPPCLQLGQFRFMENSQGEIVMSYQTDWRSRDHVKAWNENNIAQVELMKLMAKKVESMISVPIKLGSYIDHASSLHIYGMYMDKGMGTQIERMQATDWQDMGLTLEDYFGSPDGYTAKQLKSVVAAQMFAETQGRGLNCSILTMQEANIDVLNFEYPTEWDTWPKAWDAEPDPSKLARVNPLTQGLNIYNLL